MSDKTYGLLPTGETFIYDDADEERVSNFTALFVWRRESTNTTYVRGYYRDPVTGKRSYQFLHRVIMDAVGKPVKVTHKDKDGLNNSRSNLSIKVSGGISGLPYGYYFRHSDRKFCGYRILDGKYVDLGEYDTMMDAVRAVREKVAQ